MKNLTIKAFDFNEKCATINVEKNKNFILYFKKGQSVITSRGWNSDGHSNELSSSLFWSADPTFLKAFQVLTDLIL